MDSDQINPKKISSQTKMKYRFLSQHNLKSEIIVIEKALEKTMEAHNPRQYQGIDL